MANVLIIEDEQSIAELIRDYLEVNGIDSEIASSGDTGVEAALSEIYDLVLLDLMVPVIDGFEICRTLRRELDIPILMVTARKDDIDKIRGFDRGADDYIEKPFNPNELVARVKAHLARYNRLVGKAQQVLHLAGLSIDKPSRSVIVDGKAKNLTAKEFDLLWFLSSHPNQVFTKDQLFEQIWGYDAIGDVTTVTVHVRKLREKIEADPSKPAFIETVWGVGYRFKR